MSFSIKTPNPGDNRNKFFGLELARQLTQKTTQTSELGIDPGQTRYGEIFGQIPESSTITEILPYQAVMVSGEYYWPPTATVNRNRIVRCYKFNEPTIQLREWGIALDPISVTKAGRILMSGVQWLDTSEIPTPISTATHINIVNNLLTCGYNGRASVLQTMTQPMCLVELSGHRQCLYAQTTEDGLTVGAEGEVFYCRKTATGWEPTSITIPAWTTKADIDPTTDCVLLPIEGSYLAVALCD